MTEHRTHSQSRKAQVFYTLRREILAARLKVTLDQQLNRPTSSTVRRLAQMKLPPVVMPYPGDDEPAVARNRHMAAQ